MLGAAWEAYFDGSTELAAHRLVMTSGESVRSTTHRPVSGVLASSHAHVAKRQEGGAQDGVRFPRGIRPSKSYPYPGVSLVLPCSCALLCTRLVSLSCSLRRGPSLSRLLSFTASAILPLACPIGTSLLAPH